MPSRIAASPATALAVDTAGTPGAQPLPEARGRGIGTHTQRLSYGELSSVRELFATTPVIRLEAGTDVDNPAEQRSLKACGFTREGVQRSLLFRSGRWRDVLFRSGRWRDLVRDSMIRQEQPDLPKEPQT